MFLEFQRAYQRLAKLALRRGPRWYLSTWWPGESLAMNQRSLLHILAACARIHVSPLSMIQALASESRGRYRRTLLRLSTRMASGTPLIDALEQTPDALDDASVLALRLGSQSGTLLATYEMLLPTSEDQQQENSRETKRTAGYWTIITLFLGLHLLLFFAVIGPTFSAMFDEFGLKKPNSLAVLNSIGHALLDYAVVWIALALAVIWMRYSFLARRVFRRRIASQLSRTSEQRRRGELLELFGLSLEHGRSLTSALSTLARYHFDKQFRVRLLYARNKVEQGAGVWQSLVNAHLLTAAESAAVDASPSNAVSAWTLRKLASIKRARELRQGLGFLRFVQPVLVLTFALAVLFIAYTYFSMLATLIHAWA